MYNRHMPVTTHEIRVCESCGLRYPIEAGNGYGIRCPVCKGNTRLIHSRNLVADPWPHRPVSNLPVRAVLLDNIRSAWNVGSIFRSADGLGYTHIYLCGITPTPNNHAVAKTSLGAEDTVSWSYHKDAVKLVEKLKAENWLIHALEEDASARDIGDNQHPNGLSMPSILILGNEISGVDPGLLELCDKIFYIPMFGEKQSFNVAMAFSIAAYQLQKQT